MPETQDFNIRYAREEDFSGILTMVYKIIPKLYPNQLLSEMKVRNLFDKAMENDQFTCIVLVDPEDKPRGYVFACLSELYFHPIQMATCLSIWVDEDCRGHSLDLIRAFDKWARYKGVDTCVISEFDTLTPKGTSKILSWFGYTLKEKQYWKDL